MMLSVPAMAPLSPPLTGASSARAPRSRNAASTSTRRRGGDRAHVDEQMSLAQRWQQPFSPKTTSRTSGESGSMVMTALLRSATSRGLAAAWSCGTSLRRASMSSRLRL